MKKITAKFINENLLKMAYGERINYRGGVYWMSCEFDDSTGKKNIENGTIYHINQDRNISGCINGHEYAKVINGIAYVL